MKTVEEMIEIYERLKNEANKAWVKSCFAVAENGDPTLLDWDAGFKEIKYMEKLMVLENIKERNERRKKVR